MSALRFPEGLRADLPAELALAEPAVAEALDAIRESDFTALERHSPGLKGYDWGAYLRCSLVRMTRVLSALKTLGVTGGRLLDYGSYFGNFSLMLRSAGFDVTALDSYAAYGSALAAPIARLRARGIRVVDFDTVGRDLAGVADASFDVAICLGVIEHIAHTPRMLLESLNRVLAPGGRLILDTPNIAYLYKRQALARGDSIMPDIAVQYSTPVPFEGHHREYTPQEVIWMLRQLGHADIHVQMYLFSVYGLSELAGVDLRNYIDMVADPGARELIMTASRKCDVRPAADTRPWRDLLDEPEQWWFAAR